MTAMGQRHVPSSQLVHHSEAIQATVNGMTPLYANHGGNLSVLVCIFYSLGSSDKCKIIRVLLNHAVDDVNLLEKQANRVLVLIEAGYVC